MRLRSIAFGCAAALCALLALGQPSARAQGGGLPQPGWHRGPRSAGGGMMQQLSQSLHLTPAQKGKVTRIFQAQSGKARAVFSNTSLTPQQKFQKMRTLERVSVTRINAILTPAQRKKFAALRAQMWQRRPAMPVLGVH